MGKRISEYPEITTVTGDELLLVAYQGKNHSIKLSTITANAGGIDAIITDIQNQLDTNKAAIQGLTNVVNTVSLNLNNTIGRVDTVSSEVTELTSRLDTLIANLNLDGADITSIMGSIISLTQNLNLLQTQLAADEVQSANILSLIDSINLEITDIKSQLQSGGIGNPVDQSIVFDEAQW